MRLLIFFGVSSNTASFKFISIIFLNKCCAYSSRLNASFLIVYRLHLTKNKLCRFKITGNPKYANSTGCPIVDNVVSQPSVYSSYVSPNTYPCGRGSFEL